MSNSLDNLFQTLAAAKNQDEVKFRLLDKSVGEYFGARDWGIHLYDRTYRLTSVDIGGIKNVDKFVERFQQIRSDEDPLLNYVLKHHAPAHEEMVLPQGSWKQTKIYQNFCAYYNHEHIAIAPVVGEGRLVGAIYFARVENILPFNNQDLASLSAVSAHLSATLAKLRTQPTSSNSPLANCLTTRELEIAELVAQGLTNPEIGIQLWISRNTVKQTLKNIFRKLDVSTRAQMVAKLKGIC
ncbi:MAG: LuxR C-terminal-related transcriptional regulator [Pleurocapsa sp. MO_226.B13]|nr:LuxR C-terminal-related transcriptional regulator [Pleurocapsa sp. MO_226.B13]